MFLSNGYNENTTLQVLKSTDGGIEWQPIDTFTLDVGVYAKGDWHLLSYIINESNAMNMFTGSIVCIFPESSDNM